MTQFASSLFWTRDECDRFIIEVSGLEKRQFANGTHINVSISMDLNTVTRLDIDTHKDETDDGFCPW
jgi:hypothetical protein